MKTGGKAMSSDQLRKFDSDFKRQALQLAESSEKSVSEIAENLGIRADLLYRWRSAVGGQQWTSLTSSTQAEIV
jgi:transposase-like protein